MQGMEVAVNKVHQTDLHIVVLCFGTWCHGPDAWESPSPSQVLSPFVLLKDVAVSEAGRLQKDLRLSLSSKSHVLVGY